MTPTGSSRRATPIPPCSSSSRRTSVSSGTCSRSKAPRTSACSGESNLLPGIGVHELLFAVAHAAVVNAAFTHAHPAGSRFNGPERGAWYAAFALRTARAEVAFHKAQGLREIDWRESETFDFDDYLADFRAPFHDIREDAAHAGCLDPDSYVLSQNLARGLLAAGSAGIVYPSVRDRRGACLVCFRPALVTHVPAGPVVDVDLSRRPDIVVSAGFREVSNGWRSGQPRTARVSRAKPPDLTLDNCLASGET